MGIQFSSFAVLRYLDVVTRVDVANATMPLDHKRDQKSIFLLMKQVIDIHYVVATMDAAGRLPVLTCTGSTSRLTSRPVWQSVAERVDQRHEFLAC
jgi:hypothetical protein